MKESPVNLLSLDRAGLEAFFATLGEKPYRAVQMLKWLYHQDVDDLDQMTNISKKLRLRLQSLVVIKMPEMQKEEVSQDGTIKWLIGLDCGNAIETVYIPEGERATLCVSSQAGCSLNCTFCATARQGFHRNLRADEIVSQVRIATRRIKVLLGEQARITNVVMMGMGEPLMNFDPVVTAMNLMMEDNAYGLSKRRITLSTAGLVPAIDRLKAVCDVNLAVSLHAPTDELRNKLVPLNRKYPIAQLLDACRRYIEDKPHRKITFEYVMINELNDEPAHAKALAKLLADIPSMVNLIPFNRFDGIDYQPSTEARLLAFGEILNRAGIPTIKRRPRGDDINAACGQLAGRVIDRTRRSAQFRQIAIIGA